VRRFIKGLATIFVGLLYRVKVQGLENIDNNRPYLLCANHTSIMDLLFIQVKLKRWVYWMAKKELFKNPLFGKFLEKLGAFPVERGKADLSALRKALKILNEGLSSCPNTKLILNGDDSFCASIGKDLPNEAYYYGTRIAFGEYKEGSVSDGRFCIYCKVEYLYRHHTYGHLGDFFCPECGFSRPYLLTALSETPVLTDKNTKILLSIGPCIYIRSAALPQWCFLPHCHPVCA
jgi:1-acyl-sn-glycerol-3-phosphate acyltransferase